MNASNEQPTEPTSRRDERPEAVAQTFGTWFPAFCPCGRRITQVMRRDAPERLRGRPRVTCSDACRLRRQRALRQLRVRQQWLTDLLRLGREDQVSAPELVEQLTELLAGITEAGTFITRADPALSPIPLRPAAARPTSDMRSPSSEVSHADI